MMLRVPSTLAAYIESYSCATTGDNWRRRENTSRNPACRQPKRSRSLPDGVSLNPFKTLKAVEGAGDCWPARTRALTLVSARKQFVDKVGADKTGGAGDKAFHNTAKNQCRRHDRRDSGQRRIKRDSGCEQTTKYGILRRGWRKNRAGKPEEAHCFHESSCYGAVDIPCLYGR